MAFKINNSESTPGKFIVESLNIKGKYGTVDIGLTFDQLEWIEDLGCPCITGTLSLTDGLNIVSNLPVVEGDIISGTFRLNPEDSWAPRFDSDGMLKIEVEIIKLMEKNRSKQDIQSASFLFVSKTWSDNLMNRVSKAWNQVPYTDAVQEIFNTYLSGKGLQKNMCPKTIEVEVSDQAFSFIIPNWKPYEAINWLLARSFVGNKVNYIFYEDKISYKAKTLATLAEQNPVYNYFTGTQGDVLDESGREVNEDTLELRYHNLYDITFLESQDINSAVINNLFPQRLITHDIVRKKIVDYTEIGPEAAHYRLDKPITYKDNWKVDSPMGNDPLYMEDIYESMSRSPGNAGLAVYPLHMEQYDSMESYKPDLWIRQHRAQKEHYEQVAIECFAPNNFTLKVGDIINVDMTSPEWKYKTPEDPGKTKKNDLRFNGNWLISSLNRVFQGNGMAYLSLKLVQNSRKISPDHIWHPEQENRNGPK